MSRAHRSGPSRRRALASLAATSLAFAGLAAVTPAAASAAPSPPSAAPAPAASPAASPAKPLDAGRYVVVMTDRPVIGYEGGISGYARTKPAPGEDFDATSPAAVRYRNLLTTRQDRALRSAGVPRTIYRYTNAVSGFAADLSAQQAQRLASHPDVLAVTENEIRQLDTVASPEFLGLPGPGGVWEQVGGTTGRRGAGGGTVVGIIDTGITPENPSFADNGMPRPIGWRGICQAGESFPRSSCTAKLVGARYFVAGFGANRLADYETLSPYDVNGHGSHTAGTAAGNAAVPTTIDGRDFGTISGMAPAAHVAAYKVCWDNNTGAGGCASADSAAAIDAAVADGVDVLNFSISGTSSNYLDPVELQFMFAADAGIFVAASSGNRGPGASTTAHPSPWLTTVAASTHTINESTLVTGNGERFIGSSITEPLPTQRPMVYSGDIPADGADEDAAELCLPGSLDGAVAAGKLVVCDRGVNARVEKSNVVAAAGGVGMVLVNVVEGSLDTDLHRIPTVHLSHTVRADVLAYVTGAQDPTGAIVDENTGSTTEVPEIAGFSSRGPSLGAGGDILKPDISAPGVGVLAAYSPRPLGRDFDFLSGTSMSSPHIAGLAALIASEQPRWSPMAVKSAMMTTARDHASAASSDVFAAGAGFVRPREVLDPGLVYDADQDDWWDFLAGQGVTFVGGAPVSDNPIDASELNQASIAVGSLTGTQSVTRTVTNVDRTRPTTWTASVTGLGGIDVDVSPSTLTLRPGQSATYTVTFTRTTAADARFATGHLTWSDGRRDVRSPVAVRPRLVSAPAEMSPTGSTFDVPVTAGFDGILTTDVHGLVPGVTTAGTAANTGGAVFDPDDERNYTQAFSVPDGTTAVRVRLRAGNPTGDDLDLFLQDADTGAVVARSATGAANETITSTTLPPGDYVIYVQAWSIQGGAPSTTFELQTFAVGGEEGNLDVSPASVSVENGESVVLTGTLSGLAAGTPYFGWLGFPDDGGGSFLTRTLVSVG